MSGIVGSRLNNRGSGLVGSLGTDGQVLTSSGAGVGAVYEAAAGGVNTPLFRARLSGSVYISSGAYTKIAFDTCSGTTGNQDFISGGTYDTTNYKWTPGEAGYYCFTASLYAYSDTAFNQLNVFVRLNGATFFVQSLVYHKLYGGVTCTGIAYLQSTDYVDVVGYQDVGSDLSLSTTHSMNHFSGFKLIS